MLIIMVLMLRGLFRNFTFLVVHFRSMYIVNSTLQGSFYVIDKLLMFLIVKNVIFVSLHIAKVKHRMHQQQTLSFTLANFNVYHLAHI